ncbi:hypothetical protein D3OALGA1CA_2160 [Olavius algarvensis associated proteobacterium Delta 3]|nr:hypothetical protein D3OALGA1CA_2160 [Olavius algarvensis associated proteobacterium Delta 3]CAB5161565.1 hypothetical protein D3OALGB2SA_5458 [Olavius algarvensis associated proteobacterium Delta 3]
MFRLNIPGFCQTGIVSGDAETGHVRYRDTTLTRKLHEIFSALG